MGIGELLLKGTAEIIEANATGTIEFKREARTRKAKELINHLEKEFSFKDATYNEKLLHRTLIEAEPSIKLSKKYERITKPKTTKIDYINKARKDAEIGLLGEELVINYEKEIRFTFNHSIVSYVFFLW